MFSFRIMLFMGVHLCLFKLLEPHPPEELQAGALVHIIIIIISSSSSSSSNSSSSSSSTHCEARWQAPMAALKTTTLRRTAL